MSVLEEREVLSERYELAMGRIREIPGEQSCPGAYARYFSALAEFLLFLEEQKRFLDEGGLRTAALEELHRCNRELYRDILPENYGTCYADPAYAVVELGEEFGPLMAFLWREMRSIIPFLYEGRLEEVVIRLELFVEVYSAFVYAAQEGGTPVGNGGAGMKEGGTPVGNGGAGMKEGGTPVGNGGGSMQAGSAPVKNSGTSVQESGTPGENSGASVQTESGMPAAIPLPDYEDIRSMIYWFASDYAEVAAERHLEEMLLPEGNFAVDIIKNADLSDERYLYAYGEYISENELETARFLATLPAETIDTMANTYTEGYRLGFEVAGKDLAKKKTVEIRYQLGFERMMRKAVENFEEMGLSAVCYRSPSSLLYNPSIFKIGYYGGDANRQYDFDHKDDKALIFDKMYMKHKLEVTRTAFEKYAKEAGEYAGPAVVETFGEKDFEPENKPQALRLSEEQNALWVEYRTLAGELQRQYILEEERSFTIIAFPVPEIRDSFTPEVLKRLGMADREECYRAFFREVIRINTLDYRLYRDIQQRMIDVLDRADHCEVKGMKGNRTDLKVKLYEAKAPEKETVFENCVADVNIPVGEVFTSPVLKGTEGVLHVSRVYLNGLEYKDLSLTFADGRIRDYSCANFPTEKENKEFVRENVLFRHRTLPMGEFAVGTNTTAYMAAEKYGVQDKLPILIAEKTGPHFAVGDTCYSHAEEVKVFNPDGKEMVAKDNELSLLRDKAPDKAYFNCHTDITIPYDELGELAAVGRDGSRTVIIKEGRFVLPGTEELNRAFTEGCGEGSTTDRAMAKDIRSNAVGDTTDRAESEEPRLGTEIWDAYLEDGSLAGRDLYRGEKLPEGLRHAVVEVFVKHRDGSYLLVQRDFEKPNAPGLWESGAGGSVLKGEKPADGAVRELYEETGIVAKQEELQSLYYIVTRHTIYWGYLCVTDFPKDQIRLQPGETIAYKWVDGEEFQEIFQSDQFVAKLRERLKEFI